MESEKDEIAAAAARMVVEEGLAFAAAKRRAVKQLGLPVRTPLPDNDRVELAVEEYIALFCPEEQAVELAALRDQALVWMRRLAAFRPYVGGAVWQGTATRHSDIYLQLFCDDPKSAEIALIDMNVEYEPRSLPGLHGGVVDTLSVHIFVPVFQAFVGLHLMIYDHDDIRGALRPDARGRAPRGDLAALELLVHDGAYGQSIS